MTAFDTDSQIIDWPDYSADTVNIRVRAELNDNGTVDITYQQVPLFDLDTLLEQQGTLEARTDMLEHVTLLVAGRLAREFVELGIDTSALEKLLGTNLG